MAQKQRMICLMQLVVLLAQFGALSAPARGAEIQFTGGTLADLQALSPTLTFDRLVITGALRLPTGSAPALSVRELEITATGSIENGSEIGAPSLVIQASGTVRLAGPVRLDGSRGIRNDLSSCDGQDGGDLTITALDVQLLAAVNLNGGDGSQFALGFGRYSGCDGGDAGVLSVQSASLRLLNAEVTARGGAAGLGTDGLNGACGAPGSVSLTVSDLVEMDGPGITTDGVLTLTAARTQIYGPLNYGSLVESIGGQTDTAAPEVQVFQPQAGTHFTLGDTFPLTVEIRDLGVGVRSIQVGGMVETQTLPGSAVDLATETLAAYVVAQLPEPLWVTVTDNKGLATTVSVDLGFSGDVTVAAGETLNLMADMDLGRGIGLVVEGTLVLPRHHATVIRAGFLTVQPGGSIILSECAGTGATTVSFDIQGRALLAGTVDLSAACDEPGGDLVVSAAAIEVTGAVRTRGDYFFIYPTGYSSPGGDITLDAQESITLGSTARFDTRCNYSVGFGQTSYGSSGDLLLRYGINATVHRDATLHLELCGPVSGTPGEVLGDYRGAPNPSILDVVSIADQWRLLPPIAATGELTPTSSQDTATWQPISTLGPMPEACGLFAALVPEVSPGRPLDSITLAFAAESPDSSVWATRIGAPGQYVPLDPVQPWPEGTQFYGAAWDTSGNMAPVTCALQVVPQCGSPPRAELEAFTITSGWSFNALIQSFHRPLVFVGPADSADPAPGVVRARYGARDGFDARFHEWPYLDGTHPAENASALVVEGGRRTLADGSIWEAEAFGADGSHWQTVAFEAPFSGTPKLFLTVQTDHGSEAVVARVRNLTASGFEARLYTQEAATDAAAAESVAYLAVYQPSGTGSLPDGGGSYGLSAVSLTDAWQKEGAITLKLEEEQSADAETSHVAENVHLLTAANLLLAQVVTTTEADPVSVRYASNPDYRPFCWECLPSRGGWRAILQ